MTSVLVGDANTQPARRLPQPDACQVFVHVLHARGKLAGVGRILGITCKQLAVFLQRGAATGGIGNDGIVTGVHQVADIAAGQVPGLAQVSSMGLQGAATALPRGHEDVNAVAVQHADGSAIQFGGCDAGDATGQKEDPAAALAPARIERADLAKEEVVFHPGRESLNFRQPQHLQNTGHAGQRLQSRALVKAQQLRPAREARELVQDLEIKIVAQLARQPGTAVIALDLGARFLEDASVGNTGRAGRLAGAAAETAVHVRDERVSDGQATRVNEQNLVNPATRRVGFAAEQPVGRALLQAKTAMNAARIQVPGGGVRRGETCRRCTSLRFRREGAQTTNLPQFRMSLGSMARLITRMHSRSVGLVPQTLMWRFTSTGQRSTTADPSRESEARTEETVLTYWITAGGSTATGINDTSSVPKPIRPTTAQTKLLSTAARSAAPTIASTD